VHFWRVLAILDNLSSKGVFILLTSLGFSPIRFCYPIRVCILYQLLVGFGQNIINQAFVMKPYSADRTVAYVHCHFGVKISVADTMRP
jgi:hypothetical protein